MVPNQFSQHVTLLEPPAWLMLIAMPLRPRVRAISLPVLALTQCRWKSSNLEFLASARHYPATFSFLGSQDIENICICLSIRVYVHFH